MRRAKGRSMFDDDARRAEFLDLIRSGSSMRAACKVVGTSHGAYQRYAERHPEWGGVVHAARLSARESSRRPAPRPGPAPDVKRRRGDLLLFDHSDGTTTADVYKTGTKPGPTQGPMVGHPDARGFRKVDLIDIPVSDIGETMRYLDVEHGVDIVNVACCGVDGTWKVLLGSLP